MRSTFITSLIELAKKDKNIFLLVGDLGFSFIEKYQHLFPDRFINAGIAEANMIGVSAGLALSGKKPFVYSISPFVTMRCFEQVRIDLCEQNLNVILVGVGGGIGYGTAGPTHQAPEDISIMRSLPNMTVICPSDKTELRLLLKKIEHLKGPAYIRLSKDNALELYKTEPDFEIGKGIIKEEGKDATLITTGDTLSLGIEVHNLLKKKGVSLRLVSMHTVKPIDSELILKCHKETKWVYTLEEHNIIGGLGSTVAEVLANSNTHVRFRKFALPDKFQKIAGSKEYLLSKNNLSKEGISSIILKDVSKPI